MGGANRETFTRQTALRRHHVMVGKGAEGQVALRAFPFAPRLHPPWATATRTSSISLMLSTRACMGLTPRRWDIGSKFVALYMAITPSSTSGNKRLLESALQCHLIAALCHFSHSLPLSVRET